MSKRVISLDEWADQFSMEVAQEIYKTVDGIEKDKRGTLHKKLPAAFLNRFIAYTVYKTLQERPSYVRTNKEAYEFTMKNFNDMKAKIQEAVAIGFETAMSQYSGKTLEYSCTIAMVPEPSNKLPC